MSSFSFGEQLVFYSCFLKRALAVSTTLSRVWQAFLVLQWHSLSAPLMHTLVKVAHVHDFSSYN